MSKLEMMNDQQYLFGSIFVVSNRMDTLLQREFNRFDITTKQWFLSAIIENLFDKPPTMKEAAKEMGSSHQNVKQVALKLEQKGLLILGKDKKDARVTRLKLTENSYDFWKKIRGDREVFTEALFKDIDKEELAAARRVMQKMLSNINDMDKKDWKYEKIVVKGWCRNMKYKKSITILVIFIVVLSIIASLGGIFLNGGQGNMNLRASMVKP